MTLRHLDAVRTLAGQDPLNPWTRQMFVDEMAHPLSHCYVLKLGEKAVAGFICFRVIGEESELLNVGVHPGYRRAGLGRELIRLYLDVCARTGVRRSYLEVAPGNDPAVRLYRQLLFRPVGTRKRFYRGRHDALVMVREHGASDANSDARQNCSK